MMKFPEDFDVPGIYRFSDVTVDPAAMRVFRGPDEVAFEPKSLRLLLYLIENPGRLATKEELMRVVWQDTFVSDNALTRAVAQIRKSLGDDAKQGRYIETVPKLGYRFIADTREVEAEVALPSTPVAAAPGNKRLWLIAAGGLVLTAAGLWIWLGGRVKPLRLTGVQQITRSTAADLWPTFSPDGSQVAYSSNRTGTFELYVQSRAPGSVERRLTNDGQDNIQPAWSPDGQYLAYVARRRGGIGLMPVSGGATRYVTDSGDSPAWSPDGKQLVFRRFSLNLNPVIETSGLPDTTLWLVALDGSAPRALTTQDKLPGGHRDPHWTPDGRYVVFAQTGIPKPGTLWRIEVSTGRLEQMPADPRGLRSPLMAPDGKHLLFIGAIGKDTGLWQAAWKQRPELLMPAGVASPQGLTISRDGKAIAFSQLVGDSAIWTVPLSPDGTAAGEARALISDRSLRNSSPVFSADGSRIAYSSVRQGGENVVATAKPDGSETVPLTPADQAAFNPVWFGKDMTLMYAIAEKRQRSYWLQRLGEPPRRLDLRMDVQAAVRLRPSPDATKMAAHIRTPAGFQVIVEDLTTHAIRKLTPADRDIGFPCWSPDGKWMAVEETAKGSSSVLYLPANGGEIRRLAASPAQTFVFDWSPDSEKILFAGLHDGVWDIFWISRTTGHLEQLTHFKSEAGFVRYPSWSPKNDQVLFERTDLSANIYVGELR